MADSEADYAYHSILDRLLAQRLDAPCRGFTPASRLIADYCGTCAWPEESHLRRDDQWRP